MKTRAAWLTVASVALAVPGGAQPAVERKATLADTATSWLRQHAGLDVARRLLRSSDADDRVRGIERAAWLHSPEALALLLRAAGSTGAGGLDPRMPMEGLARTDPRALLAVVRGLSSWSEREGVRQALGAIVSAPSASFATRTPARASTDPIDDEAVGAARVLLARQQAALVLAKSGSTAALESLIAIARGVGPGRTPALDAIATYPAAAPAILDGVALTTPAMIGLAVAVGDLRALDAILGALRASDPALRAAAIAGLGVAGDARVLDAARAAGSDRDPRVRIAGAEALVRLGMPEASGAVLALVSDDGTALEGLRLASHLQDDKITRAAAARAIASANPLLRGAAMTALGRQSGPLAVQALVELLSSASASEAACALARSPSTAALGAIERMAREPDAARLAARAYFVRRFMRGQRSAALEALVDSLARSKNAGDRGLASEIRVALGDWPLASSLADPEPLVRRSAAMGGLARTDAATLRAMQIRLPLETDPATRVVLAWGLVAGDADRTAAGTFLLEQVRSGGPDAPIAALALSARAGELPDELTDPLLGAGDAVIRAHAARGLGKSVAPNAAARLAQAYADEPDAEVRRALLGALAARGLAGAGPAVRDALELAASLDPDPVARWHARRALSGRGDDAGADPLTSGGEVAWIRLAGNPLAQPPTGLVASLVRSDGIAVPIVFDVDGYALVPGLPPGEARLRLAPSLPAYSAAEP